MTMHQDARKFLLGHKSLGLDLKDLDLDGLGWGLRICISNRAQVRLMLLVQGPHSWNHWLRS